MKKKINIEQLVVSIGLLLTALTIFLTWLELKDSQKWKRAEFTASEYEKFNNDSSVTLIKQMLDYNRKHIRIFSDSNELVNVDSVLNVALVTELKVYNETDELIRDAFDKYLEKISVFNVYLETKLIDFNHIRPYFEYDMEILGKKDNRRKSDELKKRLWKYITFYKFTEAEKFLNRFGSDILEN